MLSVFAARPEPCPSAMITESPPPGRSTISTVSPLSRDAYLLVLVIATSMVKGMVATSPTGWSAASLNRAGWRRFDRRIINQPRATYVDGNEQSRASAHVRKRLERTPVDER